MNKYFTETNALTFAIVCLIILIVTVLGRVMDSPDIRDVLEGDALLECHMKDGVRVIPTHMILYFHEGTWVFEDNGYAKQCRIIDIHK